jgi:hypothetical protein
MSAKIDSRIDAGLPALPADAPPPNVHDAVRCRMWCKALEAAGWECRGFTWLGPDGDTVEGWLKAVVVAFGETAEQLPARYS